MKSKSICKNNHGMQFKFDKQIFQNMPQFLISGIQRTLAFNHQYLSVRRLLKSRKQTRFSPPQVETVNIECCSYLKTVLSLYYLHIKYQVIHKCHSAGIKLNDLIYNIPNGTPQTVNALLFNTQHGCYSTIVFTLKKESVLKLQFLV